MKTIAQQLNIKEFPFVIKDKNGNEIRYETPDGYWSKREYNSNGRETRYENSVGLWYKCEYDSNGNEIYYEDSVGVIIDNRPKPVIELTLEDIAKMKGVSVEQIRIKE
jgi:hypothetical protein